MDYVDKKMSSTRSHRKAGEIAHINLPNPDRSLSIY